MSAESLEKAVVPFEQREYVYALDAAPRALEIVFSRRRHYYHRPVQSLLDLSCNDACYAFMYVFHIEDDEILSPADLFHAPLVCVVLLRLSLSVEPDQLRDLGFDRAAVFCKEKLHSLLRMCHPACRIYMRRYSESDVSRCDSSERYRFRKSFERFAPAFIDPHQSVFHDRSVLVCQSHDISHRAYRRKIQHVVYHALRQSRLPAYRLHHLERYTAPRQLSERIPAFLLLGVYQYAVGLHIFYAVVIGHDHLHSQPFSILDFLVRHTAAVHCYDKIRTVVLYTRYRLHVEAVSFAEPRRDIICKIVRQHAQNMRQYAYGRHSVSVVISVYAYPFPRIYFRQQQIHSRLHVKKQEWIVCFLWSV